MKATINVENTLKDLEIEAKKAKDKGEAVAIIAESCKELREMVIIEKNYNDR